MQRSEATHHVHMHLHVHVNGWTWSFEELGHTRESRQIAVRGATGLRAVMCIYMFFQSNVLLFFRSARGRALYSEETLSTGTVNCGVGDFYCRLETHPDRRALKYSSLARWRAAPSIQGET